MLLAKETALLAVICSVDLALTSVLIATGCCTESNPILAHYLQYGLEAMCLVKLASFAVPLTLAEYYRRDHPRFVRLVLRTTLVLYVMGYVAGVTAVNRL